MSETSEDNLLAGLTEEVPGGRKSLPAMRDGEEPPDMLLAILNNVLPSMINSQQAKILATCLTVRGKATIVLFYDVEPTENGILKLLAKAKI